MKRFHISLLSVVALLSLFGCSDDSKVQVGVMPTDTKDMPSQISFNTDIKFTSNGMPRAILHAGRIRTYEAKRETQLDSGVKVDFFDKLGLHSSVLTSKSALVNNANNNMTACEHVHVVSDSGTVVDTDTLFWNNQAQTLHSDDPVRIVEKSGRVTTGVGFESDQSLTHYEIMRTTILTSESSLESPSTSVSATPPPAPIQTTFGAPAEQQLLGNPVFPAPPAPALKDTSHGTSPHVTKRDSTH